MKNDGMDAKDLLGQAKVIHLAMQHGVISYQEAKQRTKPLLRSVNQTIEQIATKHNRKPQYINFSDLGVRL